MAALIDLSGKTFGRLTVLGRSIRNSSSNRVRWHCLCECGNKVVVVGHQLQIGRTRSCGCLHRESARELAKQMTAAQVIHPSLKHGHGSSRIGQHPLYRLWANMWDRCQNRKNKDYHNYGGRSIRVCAEWRDFAVFLADILAEIGPRPEEGMKLARIDKAGDYRPGNVHWATAAQQARCSRHNVIVDGQILTDFLSQHHISSRTYYEYRRSRRDMSPQAIVAAIKAQQLVAVQDCATMSSMPDTT